MKKRDWATTRLELTPAINTRDSSIFFIYIYKMAGWLVVSVYTVIQNFIYIYIYIDREITYKFKLKIVSTPGTHPEIDIGLVKP